MIDINIVQVYWIGHRGNVTKEVNNLHCAMVDYFVKQRITNIWKYQRHR